MGAHRQGTHTGDFMGIPATGVSVTVKAIDITHFGDDGLATRTLTCPVIHL